MLTMDYQIVKLNQIPEMLQTAAAWFADKWSITKEVYLENMQQSLQQSSTVPTWYLCLSEDKIIGGMGVIENDFHSRPDLTPNICAVYTEPAYRCQGIAGRILNTVCNDMQAHGIDTLYLLTDHEHFYERYGWEFYTMVQNTGEDTFSRLYRHCMPSKVIQTERLYLRPFTKNDFEPLYAVLADSDIMQHYPYTFDEARVHGWIEKNLQRYRTCGFGLWAVCKNTTGEMIGDCGLTLQTINGTLCPEIGYHIRKDCQRQGYAKEAANAVKK